jgi:hypothetical protein
MLHHQPLKRIATVSAALALATAAPATARPIDPHAPASIRIPAPAAPTIVHLTAPSGGFDWGDAGIGVAGGVALSILGLGSALAVSGRRTRRQSIRQAWPPTSDPTRPTEALADMNATPLAWRRT